MSKTGFLVTWLIWAVLVSLQTHMHSHSERTEEWSFVWNFLKVNIWASSLGFETRKDTNRPAQSQKLVSWNFEFRNERYYTIKAANNKGVDQTMRMRRLICTFVVRIWQKLVFSWHGSYYACNSKGCGKIAWMSKLDWAFCCLTLWLLIFLCGAASFCL